MGNNVRMFFSYDPEGDGFTVHETAEDAKKAACDSLDWSRDDAADGGWLDEPTGICWGEVMGRVVETSRKSACDYLQCELGCTEDHEYNNYVEYELRPLAREDETSAEED